MPFDAAGFEPSMAVQLLDRTRQLLQTDAHWIKGYYQSPRRSDRPTRWCLYGALRMAESEIGLPLNARDAIQFKGSLQLYPISDAFLQVHQALNAAARPKLQFYRRWYQAWAMDANDAPTSTLADIHRIMIKARVQLVRQAKRDMQHAV